MGNIIWLASYPKSGNTWFRIFLTNLLHDDCQPADINQLQGSIASQRETFDEIFGVPAADLTPDETERFRPVVYTQLARESSETLFVKIHDALTCTAEGLAIVPKAITRGAIYFLRNPLDVAVSFSYHSACDVAPIIAGMGDPQHSLGGRRGRLERQLRQRVLSWSEHVQSWVDSPGLRVHVIRYEDMHAKPFETFRAAAQFAGLPDAPERIRQALEHASFARLQEAERANGFAEKPPGAELFFRRGQIGSWRDVLSEAQVTRLVQDHAAVMRRFGYLDERGEPIY
jgi:aryl sulfotransferase